MSGGSFNYVCHKVDDSSQVFTALPDLRNMEGYLRGTGKHDIADEILCYIKDLETLQRRALALGTRMHDLVHDVEWWASCDIGEDSLDKSWEEFVMGKTKND